MIDYYSATQPLLKSGVAVIPTDTIYGLVAQAFDIRAVAKVYEIKKRAEDKKCIVLIADLTQIKDFGIDDTWLAQVNEYWPGPYSLILPTDKQGIEHLTKDSATITLRLPNNADLRTLIRQTGPLIAPSANPEGMPPAENIEQAKAYFGNKVDIYVDGGNKSKVLPSTLLDLTTNQKLR